MTNKSNIISNLTNSSSEINLELLNNLEQFIQEQKRKISTHNIPISIYSSRLGILEATVKYLKENQNLAYNEIAELLNRDQRTIWNSYNKACKKHKQHFISNGLEFIDVNIFKNRDQAPLQALVRHLKDKGLTYKKISEMINRSYKTIWLTNNGR